MCSCGRLPAAGRPGGLFDIDNSTEVRPLHGAPSSPQPSSKASFFQSPPLELGSPFSSAGSRLSEGPHSSQPPSYSWIRPPRGQRGRTRKRLGVNRSDLQTHKLSLSKEPPKPTPLLLPAWRMGPLVFRGSKPSSKPDSKLLCCVSLGLASVVAGAGGCAGALSKSCSASSPEAHLRQSSGEIARTPGEGLLNVVVELGRRKSLWRTLSFLLPSALPFSVPPTPCPRVGSCSVSPPHPYPLYLPGWWCWVPGVVTVRSGIVIDREAFSPRPGAAAAG